MTEIRMQTDISAVHLKTNEHATDIAPLQGVACKQAHAACGGVWGEGWRRLVPSVGGRVRIEWIYDANAATKFATLHKKAGSCSKSNKFLLLFRYLRSPIGRFCIIHSTKHRSGIRAALALCQTAKIRCRAHQARQTISFACSRAIFCRTKGNEK